MTVEIVSAELLSLTPVDSEENIWSCWLEISQSGETWMLPATAPGTLTEGELQPYFDAQESDLWAVAQVQQYGVNLYEHVNPRRVLRAFASVVLDEINILRGVAGLPERTGEQVKAAIKAKLRQ